MNDTRGKLASGFYGDSIVGNICRDSTTIAADDKVIRTGRWAQTTEESIALPNRH
ncbi:hypothetical protein [uncultured Sphaerochaeta sp.]|uniref:hypothetical protein n=1 Tax=uncultured Sphaerochaeta sp. TaxID=886478 RepID=UPI0037498385